MRALALVLTAILLAGCAAPTANWRPLNGQNTTQIDRDWRACQPQWGGAVPLDGWDVLWVFLLTPYYAPADRHREAIERCMERAGYEWKG